MKEIILDDRLKAIVDLLGPFKVVADIGCDHGYVANYLVENNLADLVYATDISGPSLEKNKRYAYERGNEDKVISLVGDGLTPILDKEFDAIIIAGMGGDLIIKILDQAFEKIKGKTLILQPMTGRIELRKYLHDSGIRIEKETIVQDDNRFYEIMRASFGPVEPSLTNFYFANNLVEEKNEILMLYIESLLKKAETSIGKAKISDNPRAQQRVEKLKNDVKLYKELLNDSSSKRDN